MNRSIIFIGVLAATTADTSPFEFTSETTIISAYSGMYFDMGSFS